MNHIKLNLAGRLLICIKWGDAILMSDKEPEGGFQNGGWYQGRQYWEGTFGKQGRLHEHFQNKNR